MTDRNRAVEHAAARWRGNSRMWTAWNNQLLWVDFKSRWLIRLWVVRQFWRDLKPDAEFERIKYEHPRVD